MFTTFVKFIQGKATTTRLQLVGLATAQEREGNIECLAQFIANRGHKAVHEALALAKEFFAEEIAAGAFKETDENATFTRSQR